MTTRPILLPDNVARAPGRGSQAAPTPRHVPEPGKLKRATTEEAGSRNELAWLLVLDNVIDAGQAEAHWLDQVGSRLTRHTAYAPKKRARGTAGSLTERSTESAPR
jgi:hypothetical protein